MRLAIALLAGIWFWTAASADTLPEKVGNFGINPTHDAMTDENGVVALAVTSSWTMISFDCTKREAAVSFILINRDGGPSWIVGNSYTAQIRVNGKPMFTLTGVASNHGVLRVINDKIFDTFAGATNIRFRIPTVNSTDGDVYDNEVVGTDKVMELLRKTCGR
jgi:hypothetical protein